MPVRSHHHGARAVRETPGRGVGGAHLRLRVRALDVLQAHTVIALHLVRPVVHEVWRAEVCCAVVVVELEPHVDPEDVRRRGQLRRLLVREEGSTVRALVLEALEQFLNCALVADDDGVVDEDT